MTDYDVVIVGAGPAGSATALALQKAGVGRVALLDRSSPRGFAIGESAGPDVAGKLRQLNACDDLASRGHVPYHANVSRWGGQRHYDDFLHRLTGRGWHLDRPRFDQDLRDQARGQGADYLPGSLETLAPSCSPALAADGGEPLRLAAGPSALQGWTLDVLQEDRRRQLYCRYLVDASGRNNAVARPLGAERKRIDKLSALAWTVADGRKLTGRSLVEAIPQGWWYATCLPDGRGLIAFMSDADLISSEGWREPEALAQLWRESRELREWLPPQGGDTIAVTPFAAHGGFLTQATGPGWIAVGDALAAFDPLTSAGISNALGDALAAAPVIRAWLNGEERYPDLAQHYAGRANQGVSRYLREWLEQYSRETQWADQPFWARRRRA